jgi:hypothetical protein
VWVVAGTFNEKEAHVANTNHRREDRPLYREIAESAAAYAHSGLFGSRRGLLHSDDHLVVAYDNNPYADDPQRLDRELTALKAQLAHLGVTLLAQASYPRAGRSRGYTVAMVWELPPPLTPDAVTGRWEALLVGVPS